MADLEDEIQEDLEDLIQEKLLDKITISIQNNNFSEVESYIEKGFNIRFKGYRAFEKAAENDNVEMYSHLWKFLEFKNDEEKKDIADYLFVESIVFEALDVLEFLSPYVELEKSKRTPLIIAVNTDNNKIINLVLSKNPPVLEKNNNALNKIINLDNVEFFLKIREHLIESGEINKLGCDINEYTKLLAKEKIQNYIQQEEDYELLDNALPEKKVKTIKKKI